MGTINGRPYSNYAQVRSFTYDASGTAIVTTTNGSEAPHGHLGAQASLWHSSGVLCTDTAWSTNLNGPTSAWGTSTAYDCGTGYYKGDGQVRVWRPGAEKWEYGYPVRTGQIYQAGH